MFEKVLVANRGEIACRVIRTLKKRGIRSVGIYSDADARALHVRLADEACRIGPGPVAQSYLNGTAIIAVANATGCDAVHPGYGLLSENAEFSRRCAEAGLVFIGPLPQTINTMGDKILARRTMAQAGVPVVPGTLEPVSSSDEGRQAARFLGYPILIKAAAGGGGIGMVLANNEAELVDGLRQCQQAAKRYFGDERIYLERYIPHGRHIEIQVLADAMNNIATLPERECSIQRRHQKLIEESPSSAVTREVRQEMQRVARVGSKTIGYRNVGTLEFLLDPNQQFYFMEMNTRIQVEHAVTEEISGEDLVDWQLRLASGELLTGHVFGSQGWAIEARIYAEDPERFIPSPGTISTMRWPDDPDIRIDTGVQEMDSVSPFYDPLLAKMIAAGTTRTDAVNRLLGGLEGTTIEGVRTNLALLRAILHHPRFQAGEYSTEFLHHPGILGELKNLMSAKER